MLLPTQPYRLLNQINWLQLWSITTKETNFRNWETQWQIQSDIGKSDKASIESKAKALKQRNLHTFGRPGDSRERERRRREFDRRIWIRDRGYYIQPQKTWESRSQNREIKAAGEVYEPDSVVKTGLDRLFHISDPPFTV